MRGLIAKVVAAPVSPDAVWPRHLAAWPSTTIVSSPATIYLRY
jgi:hypothetical protein